jgi:hypothetical protein
MNETMIRDIERNLQTKNTEELLAIWQTENREEYSDEGFEAVRRILGSRGHAFPPKTTSVEIERDIKKCPAGPRGNDYVCTEWTTEEIKRRRTIYLLVFLFTIAGNIAGAILAEKGVINSSIFEVNFLMGIVFLAFFAWVAKGVLKYSTGTLVGMSLVILFIPFISILMIAIIDRKIYDAIKQKETPTGQVKRQISSLAVFSLVFCFLPYVGLPMAICAVRKISKSEGRLSGKELAWVSIGVNCFLLAMMIFGITMYILTSKSS